MRPVRSNTVCTSLLVSAALRLALLVLREVRAETRLLAWKVGLMVLAFQGF